MVFKVKAARSPVTLCAAATGARLPPAEFMADLAADPFLTRAAKSADARRTAALGVAALVGFVGDSLPGRGYGPSRRSGLRLRTARCCREVSFNQVGNNRSSLNHFPRKAESAPPSHPFLIEWRSHFLVKVLSGYVI